MAKGERGRYLDDGPAGQRGLYLIVQHKRASHWELRYQLNGRARWMGLGSASVFDLATARERAKRERQKLADGTDPLEARRADRAAQRAVAAKAPPTFAEAARQYLAQHQGKWRNRKHGAQWKATLIEYANPIIGDLLVSAIDTPLVLKVVEQPVKAERGYPAGPLWYARSETASRLRGRIEAVLAWATVRGYRSGDNPARWRGHLKEALPTRSQIAKTRHHAALPYADLPAFMPTLRESAGVAPRALEFAILCAARTGEVLGAKWSEIDFDNSVWTVPASRMKAHREHRVPLSPDAVKLLKTLYREDRNEYIFVGLRPRSSLSNMALTAVLRRMGQRVTAHGFRSTFRTWAAEQTNYPREVAEQALAHIIPDAVERSYNRTTLFDKRRRLMQQWARYCASEPALRRGGEVVTLHKAKRS